MDQHDAVQHLQHFLCNMSCLGDNTVEVRVSEGGSAHERVGTIVGPLKQVLEQIGPTYRMLSQQA